MSDEKKEDTKDTPKATPMDIITMNALIELLDLARVNIMGLGRILRGTLNANSKILLRNEIDSMIRHWPNKGADAVAANILTQLRVHAEILLNAPSDDNGGYKLIEKTLNDILYWIGFLKGYLFLKYEQCKIGKPDLWKKDDFDPDDFDKLTNQMKHLRV